MEHCFICLKPDKVTRATRETYAKLVETLKFRKSKSLTFSDAELPDSFDIADPVVYHTQCYTKFMAVRCKYQKDFQKMPGNKTVSIFFSCG